MSGHSYDSKDFESHNFNGNVSQHLTQTLR